MSKLHSGLFNVIINSYSPDPVKIMNKVSVGVQKLETTESGTQKKKQKQQKENR